MAEQIYERALTTVQRVKDRLVITSSTNDAVLLRLVNACTDFIEGQCDRRFKETTYTNEVHSIVDGQKEVILNNTPVSALTSTQYRAGMPSSPNWTDYPTDSVELSEDGSTGIIHAFGRLVRGSNAFRATYTAGYKINFANAGDMNTHTLPADITDLCERLVVRVWKRREAEGKTSEGINGSNIGWAKELNEEDKMILNKYTITKYF